MGSTQIEIPPNSSIESFKYCPSTMVVSSTSSFVINYNFYCSLGQLKLLLMAW